MTKQTSIQHITDLLDKPGAISEADQSSIASLRQSFPYFVPVRYMEALASHRKNQYAPAMLSAIRPYMGDWMMFCDFLQAGATTTQPAKNEAKKNEPAPQETQKILKNEKEITKESAVEKPVAQPVKDAKEIPAAPPIVKEPVQPVKTAAEVLTTPPAAKEPAQPVKTNPEVLATPAAAKEPVQPIKTNPEILTTPAEAKEPAQPIKENPEVLTTQAAANEPAQPTKAAPEVLATPAAAKEPAPPIKTSTPAGKETAQPIKNTAPITKEITQPIKINTEALKGNAVKEEVPQPKEAPATVSSPAPIEARQTEVKQEEVNKQAPVEEKEAANDPFATLMGSAQPENMAVPDAAPLPGDKGTVPEIEENVNKQTHWIVEDYESKQPAPTVKEVIAQDDAEEDKITMHFRGEAMAEEAVDAENAGDKAKEAPNAKEEKPLIYPVYTDDYFLQQGVKVSAEIPETIEEFKSKVNEEDKSLMVMMSFTEWLLHFKNTSEKQKEENKDQRALKSMWQKEKLAAAMEEENEEIPENVFEMAVNSIAKEDGLASESLAEIYIKQEKYDKAIEMYRKLSLRNPQKNAYFARKIEEILKEKLS